MASVSVEESSCVQECEGLVVNIVKTETKSDQTPELLELYEEYERFKTRNTSRAEYSELVKGF